METNLSFDGINRRTLLQSAGTALSISTLTTTSVSAESVKETDAHLGKRQFIQVVLEHDDAPSHSKAIADGIGSYVVDKSNRRLLLTTAPLAPFEASTAIGATPRAVRQLPGTVHHEAPTRSVPLTSDFRGLEQTHLVVEKPYESPSIEVRKDGDAVIATADDKSMTVKAGREESIQLAPRDAVVRPPSTSYIEVQNDTDRGADTVTMPVNDSLETESITPVVRVHNHGQLDVYGIKDGIVLPIRTDDPYAAPIVSDLLTGGDGSSGQIVTTDESHDMLVVTEEVDN